jgi:hypothetical protein
LSCDFARGGFGAAFFARLWRLADRIWIVSATGGSSPRRGAGVQSAGPEKDAKCG